MAINVDQVYKTVLLIINKEQRGYLTPNEFNKLATQVQLDVLDNYFETLNTKLDSKISRNRVIPINIFFKVAASIAIVIAISFYGYNILNKKDNLVAEDIYDFVLDESQICQLTDDEFTSSFIDFNDAKEESSLEEYELSETEIFDEYLETEITLNLTF